MGSSGRNDNDIDAANGAQSLLNAIRQRKSSPSTTSTHSTGSTATSSNAVSVSAQRVDRAERLLNRMSHWFRRRNGVAATKEILKAFRDDVHNRGNGITPNIFKGLLMSICAFKNGYWILNDDDDDSD